MNDPKSKHITGELTPIGSLTPSNVFNVIGIVTDVVPPKETVGTDCVMSFTLVDQTTNPNQGLKVILYERVAKKFIPLVVGDGVKCSNIKVSCSDLDSNLQWFVTRCFD